MKYFFAFILLFAFQAVSNAQDTLIVQKDSAKVKPKPKVKTKFVPIPKRAVLWGAIIPGGGQIYNRRYWKAPLVWGGMAGIGYWFVDSYTKFRCYKKAYIAAIDNDPQTNYICPYNSNATPTQMRFLRNAAQSQSEYAAFAFFGFYGLVLLEAFVDAHLRSFDVSDNLTLSIRPSFQYTNALACPSLGIKLRPKEKMVLARPIEFY